MEELERRLRGRGDTPEDQIQMRLKRAAWEMSQKDKYELVVINDTAQACAEKILNFIAEKGKE
jgi:guanylate kinase